MKIYIQEQVRTNNFTDPLISEKIGTVWQQANDKLGDFAGTRYAIYTDYQCNYRGDYLLAIGTTERESKETLTLEHPETYRKYAVDPEDKFGVFATWQQIWDEEEQGKIVRAYTADYEEYTGDGAITIYVAIK